MFHTYPSPLAAIFFSYVWSFFLLFIDKGHNLDFAGKAYADGVGPASQREQHM
jgi:hypothetical protein